MKILILICIFLSFLISSFAQNTEREYDNMFFENSPLPGNYFYSSVAYSEGCYVKNINGKLPVCEKEFFTPPNSLELEYTNSIGNWEANVLFERIRGNDFFKKSNFLSFWMLLGNTNSELLPDVTIIKQKKQRGSDVLITDYRTKKLSINNYMTENKREGWRFVKIPLKDFGTFDGNPTSVVFSNSQINGEGRILIDQVELLPEVTVAIVQPPDKITSKAYELHVDIIWPQVESTNVKYIEIYRSEDNKRFRPVGIQRPYFNRFTDFTGESNKAYFYKISYIDYQYNETATSKTAKATTR